MSKGEVQLGERPQAILQLAGSWGRAEQKQTGCISFKQVAFHFKRLYFIYFL